MKDTNEIEKQLQRKADKYIEQKAKEMFGIHREIAMYLDSKLPNYIDYYSAARASIFQGLWTNGFSQIAWLFGFHTKFTRLPTKKMQLKYQKDLAKNYKEKLVAKYTRELITKIKL